MEMAAYCHANKGLLKMHCIKNALMVHHINRCVDKIAMTHTVLYKQLRLMTRSCKNHFKHFKIDLLSFSG